MEHQLVAHYLDPLGIQHGMYLVGYFTCSAWDPVDYRRTDSRRHGPIHQVRTQLESQAAQLTSGAREVRVAILNCTLPDSTPATGTQRRRSAQAVGSSARRSNHNDAKAPRASMLPPAAAQNHTVV